MERAEVHDEQHFHSSWLFYVREAMSPNLPRITLASSDDGSILQVMARGLGLES
jgi:hypothetical protein